MRTVRVWLVVSETLQVTGVITAVYYSYVQTDR
jgi:hypothetical protein